MSKRRTRDRRRRMKLINFYARLDSFSRSIPLTSFSDGDGDSRHIKAGQHVGLSRERVVRDVQSWHPNDLRNW